ncbi:hypothetical protein PHLCEN_2v6223 [Hermanssonia centrifuga]|uniref:SHSP domain-containing protein n=1 Tax=Hermanssonia centrifuga TaxID=98765 RepID=A0A2R6P051_9APHY|nr:hypothetical protein PHLCEN_2v6223 [Hermanssonia centrifuga]
MSLSYFFSEPFYTLTDFDRLFDEAFTDRSHQGNQVPRRSGSESGPTLLRPRVDRMDVHEDARLNILTATFELPGIQKEDINIDVHDNVLKVSGESKISSERDEGGYAVRERRYGKFSRSISLPQGTKSEDIKASLENGILTVSFTKTSSEQAPKKITVS